MVSRKTRLMSAFLAILMVVSMLAAFVLPAVAETTYPSVSTVTAENPATGTDYAVGSVADWMYLFNNHATLLANRDITIHLTADIDLSDAAASTFTGFKDAMFSFDGHGKTIKNWKPSAKVTGLFYTFEPNKGMNSLKNFTLTGCEVTAATSHKPTAGLEAGIDYGTCGSGLVLGLPSRNPGLEGLPSEMTLENINVLNCKYTTTGEAHGILVGRFANNSETAATLNIKNCALIGNTMTATAAHHGFVIGKINKNNGDVTVNISDIYLSGNTLTNTGGAGGLLFGKFENGDGTLMIDNIGIFDNNITVSSGEANIIGSYVSVDITTGSTTKNVLMRGNSTAGSKSAYMIGANPQDKTGWTFSDCLIGTDEKMGGKGAAEVAIDPAQFTTGEAAHRINSKLTNPSFYWAMEDGKIVPATAATQTRKVTIKREGLSDKVLYANGGSEIYLPYKQITSVTGEGAAVENQVLTVGTADVTVVVPAGGLADANDYTTFPDPAGVINYPDAPGYLVDSLEDLENVQKNVSRFTAAQTIHLGADITVTEGSVANNMTGLKASINGHGKAIKNVKFTGTGKNTGGVGDAWLSNYTGASIQNLTLEGWNATNLGWGGGMLIAVSDQDLVIKNVTVKACSAASAASQGYHSFLVGNNRGGNLTMENIRVEGSDFIQPAIGSDNMGMILGRFYSNGLLKINNVYAIGNTITGPGCAGSAMGGLIGELQLSQAATISNVALLNTTYKNEPHLSGLVIGRLKKGDVTLSNVIAATDGYANVPLLYRKEEGATVPGTVTLTNVYTDAAYMQSGYGIETPVAGNATAEEVSGGGAAYKLNAAGVSQKWMMEGGYPAFSKNGVTMKQFEIIKEQRNGSYASEYAYYNPGDKAELTLDAYNLLASDETTTVTGYTYENKKLSFTMPDGDVAAKFELTGADFTVIEKIKDKYAPYAGKFYPFTQGDAMKAAYDKAVEVLGKIGTFANKNEEFAAWDEVVALDAAVTEIKLVDTFTSVDNYNAPLGRDYDLFKSFDPTNWIVAEDDDWRGLVEDAGNVSFSGVTIHFVDDIDMEDKAVAPLSGIGSDVPFSGTIHGHNHVIKRLLVKANATATCYVGLVGYASGALIQNLGIESGLITADANTESEVQIGAFVGEAKTNTVLRNCWNGANVDYAGYASASGIGRLLNSCVIDGCYNIGLIKAKSGYSSGLSGFSQQIHVYNSFSASNSASMLRYSGGVSAKDYAHNTYLVTDNAKANYNAAPNLVTPDNTTMANYILGADAYATGELAWRLNSEVKTDTGVATYYTMKNGKTVFGTEATQTRKVTFKCADVDDLVVYYNGGDEINLNYADNVEKYEITAGTATLDGNKLTMGITDLTIQVTLDGLNYTLLKAAMAKYDGKNTDYFVTADGTSLTTLFAQAEKYIANQVDGATQADVNALTDQINAKMSYTAYPNLPKASEYEKYSDAVKFLIADVADMNYVAGNKSVFTAGKELHFAENVEITVPDDAAANSWNGVNAAIDGHGATVIGVDYVGTATGNAVDGWLGVYSGAFLKNLTFKNWSATNLGWQGALLIASVTGHTVFENLHFEDCSVTKGERNGLAILVGLQQSNVNTTYSNITFKDCVMDYANVVTGNCSFLIGKVGAGTVVADDIYLNGNKVKGTNELPGSGRGLVIGEVVTGTATFTDIGVFNTTYEGKAGSDAIIGGMVKHGATLNISRVLAANNGETATLILHEDRDIKDGQPDHEPATAINVSNIYTDTAHVVKGNMADQVQQVIESAYTTEDIMGGKAVYELNKVEGAKTYAIKDGTPVMATAGLPLAITYKIAEVEYDTALGGVEDVVLYTDADGKLIGMTEMIKADLEAAAFWGADVKWDGTFEADATYTGTPYPAHTEEHETSLVPNADGVHHTIVCNHKEGDAICKYTEEAACVFDQIVCLDKNAEPEDAKHQAGCLCGNKKDAERCTFGEPIVDAPTVEKPGSITHECEICDYKHIELVPALMGLVMEDVEGYCGDEMIVEIGLLNNHGLGGATFEMTYSGNDLALKDIELMLTGAHEDIPVMIGKTTTDPDTGMVTVCFNLLTNQNYTGTDLLKITFEVKEDATEGKGTLELKVVDAADFEGGEIGFEDLIGNYELFDRLPGDATGDKMISIKDAVLMMRLLNNDATVDALNPDRANADVNRNGSVDVGDVILVLQYLNGAIDLEALYAAGENG